MNARIRNLFACALVLLLALSLGCGAGSDGPGAWPPGTVAVINGSPISMESVDADIAAILDIEPGFTEGHRRRMILTHCALPKAFGIAVAGEQRAQVLEAAKKWLENGSKGPPEAGPQDLGDPTDGNWLDIGLETWLVARELEPGQTSGIVEFSGRFAVIRMVRRNPQAKPDREVMKIVVQSFPYVSNPGGLIDRCVQGPLQIVDPAWESLIPAKYKYSTREAE